MELKVWVDGVLRVVCGLSYTTSCQDVVIALAQAIGQTGRYVLILKLRGTERQLVATDCPLQAVAQLGQQATEVQFILRRTGLALSNGPDGSETERKQQLPRHPEPAHLGHSHPQKALSFHLGPSTFPRRRERKNGAYSPSPRGSPEPRASPVSFQEPVDSTVKVRRGSSRRSKEESFRQILKQQLRLQDLEAQLQALEFELWECERSSSPAPVPTPGLLAEDLEVLEMRARQNEAELMHGEHWEEQLEVEINLEKDMHRCLDTINTSVDEHSSRLQQLEAHSAQLGQDLKLEGHRLSSQAASEDSTLGSLKQELQNRLQQGKELTASLIEKEEELQAVMAMLEERYQLIDECNKDLRQFKLQQFIQQTGVTPDPPYTDLSLWDHPHPPPPSAKYLSNAGIMEDDLAEAVSVC
ncbi:Ras association domain-containing protein 8 [Merluccius polli]|uniref:Ras association domain-containing protein 8 n=1 Tax=Merluccius polli TaxID=89951 RepID=A0AA47MZF2_MERPO|nr:Ras association domain-containing protein 8 [Merluccius polli]